MCTFHRSGVRRCRRSADPVCGGGEFLLGCVPCVPIRFCLNDYNEIGKQNFVADFVYSAYVVAQPEMQHFIWDIAADYAQATLLLRLPGYSPMPAFPQVVDVPLVVRKARLTREQVILCSNSGATLCGVQSKLQRRKGLTGHLPTTAASSAQQLRLL